MTNVFFTGGWVLASVSDRPLAGFSHGASGMVAALAALHGVTGDRRYLRAAEAGLAYERSVFDEESGNWPDLRAPYDPARPRHLVAWCHGAPGVAMARLCLRATPLWDEATAAELTTALTTTAGPAAGSGSLCCGRAGRVVVLRTASARTGEVRWAHEAAAIARRGFPSAPGRPGVFQGLAGSGLVHLDGDELAVLPTLLSAGLL